MCTENKLKRKNGNIEKVRNLLKALHKIRCFPLKISSVNVTKSAVSCVSRQKERSVKTEIIFFIPKQDLHPSGGDVCLYHIKILSDISNPEFYSLKTNVYKPSEKFDFPKIEWPY